MQVPDRNEAKAKIGSLVIWKGNKFGHYVSSVPLIGIVTCIKHDLVEITYLNPERVMVLEHLGCEILSEFWNADWFLLTGDPVGYWIVLQ